MKSAGNGKASARNASRRTLSPTMTLLLVTLGLMMVAIYLNYAKASKLGALPASSQQWAHSRQSTPGPLATVHGSLASRQQHTPRGTQMASSSENTPSGSALDSHLTTPAPTQLTLDSAQTVPTSAQQPRPPSKYAALKECAPNCAANGGTCNRDLGRCDCPPFMAGAACTEPLFPACTDQWGFKMPVAPIGIHIQPSFPTTCECLWQARQHLRLDSRQERSTL